MTTPFLSRDSFRGASADTPPAIILYLCKLRLLPWLRLVLMMVDWAAAAAAAMPLWKLDAILIAPWGVVVTVFDPSFKSEALVYICC